MLAHAYMISVCGVTLAELGTVQCLLCAQMFSHSSTNSFERVRFTSSVLVSREGGAAVVPLSVSSVQFGSCQLVVEHRVVVLFYNLLWCCRISYCISEVQKYLVLVRPTKHRMVWFCCWLVWEHLLYCFEVWICRLTWIIFKYPIRTALVDSQSWL